MREREREREGEEEENTCVEDVYSQSACAHAAQTTRSAISTRKPAIPAVDDGRERGEERREREREREKIERRD